MARKNRWRKRNHKFWAIVRLKSKRHYGRKKRFSSSKKSHNYLSNNYGGWKNEIGKYHNKGKFDYLTYLRKTQKPHKKKWVDHYKGRYSGTKPSDFEKKGVSPFAALKAWARNLGHYE